MTKYYDNARDNAAFDRCIDVMARLLQKYENQVLQQESDSAEAQVNHLDVPSDDEKKAA